MEQPVDPDPELATRGSADRFYSRHGDRDRLCSDAGGSGSYHHTDHTRPRQARGLVRAVADTSGRSRRERVGTIPHRQSGTLPTARGVRTPQDAPDPPPSEGPGGLTQETRRTRWSDETRWHRVTAMFRPGASADLLPRQVSLNIFFNRLPGIDRVNVFLTVAQAERSLSDVREGKGSGRGRQLSVGR